jgi:predicted O-methyltransferase YrrM
MDFSFNNTPFFEPDQKRDIPSRTGEIDIIQVVDKLKELNHFVGENLTMGNFDQIGELTAKKTRHPSSEYYQKYGCFFRPNYERGLLLYALVRHLKIESFLEIGFGRGYGTLCVAMAMHENGSGKITTVDPNFDENHIKRLQHSYPDEWFHRINFVQSTSEVFFDSEEVEEKYDLIFLDGDHRYEAVKSDWDSCKNRFDHALIFDDYHLPGKEEKDIEVSSVVDHLEEGYDKQLIISDRRIFVDDRGFADDLPEGMVFVTRK